MNYKEKVCIVCGKTYIPTSPNQCVCCLDCGKERERRLALDRVAKGYKKPHSKNEYQRKPRAEAKRVTIPEEDLETTIKHAAELGLTYGQYVTKKYFKTKGK